ncbi:MAG: glycine cleavage system aminomethyltransferase GcvT [Thermoanaerobacteraceae bacterium]|nr:glycine cleavage system aminomethyltransferase GcvT [Thermoanaerobacteraceae bacterium]
MKKTPLHKAHLEANAKMVNFGGWHMPVQYVGILEEHRNVRTKAGLFDVSHMGEIDIKGNRALELVQKLITNDASKLAVKQALYTPMCLPNGGIVDDLLVYRKGENHFLLVVNAANTDKDYQWIEEHAIDGVAIANISSEVAQLALQGPLAEQILQKISNKDLSQIKFFWFDYVKVDGEDCLVSRTGYTGEDGFEIYLAPDKARKVWYAILEAGKEEGVMPIGLGARDTLRFEARLPLYGNELSEEISPLEAGLEMFVKLDKDNFIGKEALEKQKAAGVKRKLVGLEMLDRGIPRTHYKVLKDGEEIGFVTSGSFSPTLEKNIGLALIKAEHARIGNKIEIQVRGRNLKAKIVKTPFYKREVK